MNSAIKTTQVQCQDVMRKRRIYKEIQLSTSTKCTNIKEIQRFISSEMFPNRTTCYMLLLLNLAELEWSSIPCNESLLSHVLCVHNTQNVSLSADTTNTIKTGRSNCLLMQFEIRNSCHLFLWKPEGATADPVVGQCRHQHSDSKGLHFTSIAPYKFLFEAVSTIFPPFLSQSADNPQRGTVFSYVRHLNTFQYRSDHTSFQRAEGFLVCINDKHQYVLDSILFACETGGFVSDIHVCDGVTDCPNDNSDEKVCTCSGFERKTHKYCTTLITREAQCSQLHFSTYFASCEPFVSIWDIMLKIKERRTTRMKFNNKGICSVQIFANTRTDTSCSSKTELRCSRGHDTCYNISSICVYKLNICSHLIPCRNGGHLQNCKEFHCNAMFKCLSSYCIPWAYVCNGKWDCAKGQDESQICGFKPRCVHMYKCKNSHQICIHLGNVCDDVLDCQLGDDEYHCDLKSSRCSTGCQCLSLAISCTNTNIPSFTSPLPFISVYFIHSSLGNLQNLFIRFQSVKMLTAKYCSIVDLCLLAISQRLSLLDLQGNLLAHIARKCMGNFQQVKSLSVNDNQVTTVQKDCFQNLTDLSFLNLSSNPLICLPSMFENAFVAVALLQLRNISVQDMEKHAFITLKAGVTIDTTDYHICCISPPVSYCTSAVPRHTTCSHLLATETHTILFALISSFVFIFNIASATVHFATRERNKSFAMIVFCLNITDILCALYLYVLWVTDVVLDADFLVLEEKWKSSIACFFAFCVLLQYTILSQPTSLFLSVSRFMVIKHPISTNCKKSSFVKNCLVILTLTSVSISLSMTALMMILEKKLPFALCHPFVDPSETVLVLHIMTWVNSFAQTFVSLCIIVLHIGVITELEKSQLNIQKYRPNQESNTMIKVQLFALTLSDFLSWLSANIVCITVYLLAHYSQKVLLWTAVLCLPTKALVFPASFLGLFARRHLKESKMYFSDRKLSVSEAT